MHLTLEQNNSIIIYYRMLHNSLYNNTLIAFLNTYTIQMEFIKNKSSTLKISKLVGANTQRGQTIPTSKPWPSEHRHITKYRGCPCALPGMIK